METATTKKMGFLSLLMMGIGYIIGTGVFTMLPSVIGLTGRSVCLSMLLAAAISIASVIPTMFLSSVIDLKGGAYSQNLALFPPVVAGVFSIMQMIAYLGFAGIAVGLASYTLQLIPGISALQKVVAMVYLVLFFLLGIKGVTLSSKLQNVMVIILLVALGIYIFGGLPHVQPGFFSGKGFFTGGAKGFLTATALLSMSSMGASAMINFTSVTKNPQRTIPLAMISSTALVAVFYFLIAVVTGGIVPIEQVAGQNLGVVAETFMAQPIYLFFMIGGALFALGTTLNANLAAIPYPWIKMAEDGWLPKVLTRRDARFGYPYVLMGIIFVIGAVLPVVFGLDIATITSLFSFPSFVVMTLVAVSAFRIPRLFPEKWRTSVFHVPTPVFYLLMAVAAAACLFLAYSYIDFLNWKTLLLALAVLAVIAAYAVWRYKAGYVKTDKTELTRDPE